MTLAYPRVTLNMQVLIQISAEGSDQLVLCRTQPALAVPGRHHLLAERVVAPEVADLVPDIPFAIRQQIISRQHFIGHEKTQVQTFDDVKPEV
ncbi:hypothetical protein D3C76_1188960 [compost metagenome]